MTTFQIVIVVLLAVLVATAVPVLVQLRRTLSRAEEVLSSVGPKLDRTLDETSQAVARLNRVGQEIERQAEGVRVLTDAAAGLGHSLVRIRDTVHSITSMASALIPSAFDGLRSLLHRERPEERPSPRRRQVERTAPEDEAAADDIESSEQPARRAGH